MISRGDDSARNAFRAGLRDDTPLPANVTQELDARDILEVQDVADAIARAEQSTPVLSKSRPRDIFDLLAKGIPTDDASGPALPVIPMPPSTQPIVDPSDDAYYHPGGRVRSLADVTLDGFRPEPTLAVRIRERRTTFGWFVLALLLPLAVLAIGALASRRSEGTTPAVGVTTTTQAITPKLPAAKR